MENNLIDVELFNAVADQCPKFTREIAEGFAISQLKNNEAYIDTLFKQIAISFPPNLRYLGSRAVSPQEEFKIVSGFKRGNKRIYDMSKSNVYLRLYRFALDDVEKTVPMYHIFVGEGAMLYIKNASYFISPVIADVGLSVKGDSLFMHMHRARLTFKKFITYVMANGERTSTHLVWSQVYNTKTRQTLSTLVHYLFCKYGVHETFRRCGVDITVVHRKDISLEKYPEDKYVTCTTFGRRPGNKKKSLIPSEVAIIVPRKAWDDSRLIRSLVGGFFYIADVFPHRVTIDDYDSPKLWRVLLGRIILPPGDSEGKVINQINTHIASVDGYVDGLVTERLADDGHPNIHDTYELFKLIINEYPKLVAQNTDSVASTYGKRLVVNLYVNKDIINAISRVLFSVQKQISSKGQLKSSDFDKILMKTLKYDTALRINRGHREVRSVSSASDCLIHKITSVTMMQTEMAVTNNGPTFDESKYAHVSVPEHGGVMNLPDADPSGRSRLNGCSIIDSKGTFLRNPELIEILDAAQEKIKR